MANGRIELVHNFTGETGIILLVFYKTTAPLSEAPGYVTGSGLGAQNGTTVTRVRYNPAHAQQSLLIENLDPVMYDIKAYRSADGTALTEQINIIAIDASKNARYILTSKTYRVGRGGPGDPADGATGLRDALLLGANYTVYERGTGPMIPPGETENEYIDRSDAGGGFDWTNGKLFFMGGIYTVTIQERQDLSSPLPGSGGDFNDVATFNTNRDLAPTDYGKLLPANFAAAVGTLTIPVLATVTDGKFKVSTYGGSQRNIVIQLNAGDSVNFYGARNKIVLGKGEWMTFLVKTNVLYVLDTNVDYSILGEPRFNSAANLLNRLAADGTLNAEANYPRVSVYLDSITTVSMAAWATDKGKWAREAGNFKPPDLTGQTLKGVTSNPGRTELDKVGPFTLTIPSTKLSVGEGGGSDIKLTTGNEFSPGAGIDIIYAPSGVTENTVKNIGYLPTFCI